MVIYEKYIEHSLLRDGEFSRELFANWINILTEHGINITIISGLFITPIGISCTKYDFDYELFFFSDFQSIERKYPKKDAVTLNNKSNIISFFELVEKEFSV